MKRYSSSKEKQTVEGVSFKHRGGGTDESLPDMRAFPEGPPVLDYREPEPSPKKHKYQQSMKTLIPFRFGSHSHPLDDAGFFSFTTFAWMTPMMWRIFKDRLDEDSLFLSPHDGAHVNGERFQRLWDEEVARVGVEKASLPKVLMRFQKTRFIVSFLASVLFAFTVFIGPMINVLTSDGYRLFEAVIFGTFLLCVPVLLIICIIYSCFILGYTALIGVLIYLVFLPIQFFVGRLTSVYRRRAVSVTDRRVRTMNEILTCIKLIKMYAWEESFEKTMTDIRKKEMLLLQKAGYVQSLNASLTTIVPTIASIVTFIVHTALQFPLLPSTKIMLVQNPEGYLKQDKNMNAALAMVKASFSWRRPNDTNDKVAPQDLSQNGIHHADHHPALRNISFSLSKGSLLGVCGNVGSGKTSLISSILEQMHLVNGSVSANGTFAYVSQQAWIFHGTVRDNILMGESFDQSRYASVIHACSLKPDLAILPYGDQTEIGERGINLSGGQKQRVSLARAVYSNRDIFLLDDPLSAVDAHVGKHIFEECIKKELKG
ncbi:hypothetical protein DNTS_020480, partial [Danionella cerebrum]